MKNPRQNFLSFVLLMVLSLEIRAGDESQSHEPGAPIKEVSEKELVRRAHDLYMKGTEGDKKAVIQAESALYKILDQNPKCSEARALLGATFTLKARDTIWVNKKIGFARKGIEMMDLAAEASPDNLQVRWIRGSNNVHMPDFLKRSTIARQDLELLWKTALESPEKLSLEMSQKSGHLLGMAHFQSGEENLAEETWEKATKLAPNSAMSQKIAETAARLKKEAEESKNTDRNKLKPGRFRR